MIKNIFPSKFFYGLFILFTIMPALVSGKDLIFTLTNKSVRSCISDIMIINVHTQTNVSILKSTVGNDGLACDSNKYAVADSSLASNQSMIFRACVKNGDLFSGAWAKVAFRLYKQDDEGCNNELANGQDPYQDISTGWGVITATLAMGDDEYNQLFASFSGKVNACYSTNYKFVKSNNTGNTINDAVIEIKDSGCSLTFGKSSN